WRIRVARCFFTLLLVSTLLFGPFGGHALLSGCVNVAFLGLTRSALEIFTLPVFCFSVLGLSLMAAPLFRRRVAGHFVLPAHLWAPLRAFPHWATLSRLAALAHLPGHLN